MHDFSRTQLFSYLFHIFPIFKLQTSLIYLVSAFAKEPQILTMRGIYRHPKKMNMVFIVGDSKV